MTWASKNLVKVLEPRYNLPSRRYFAEVVIPDMYQQVKERVVTFLKQQAVYYSFVVICDPGFHVEFNSTLHLLRF